MRGERSKGPEKIGRLVEAVLKQASGGRERRPESLAAVTAWPEVVGGRLSAVSRALELKDGRLFVEAQAAAWKQELILLKKNLIRKMNRRLGDGLVGDIVINVREFRND